MTTSVCSEGVNGRACRNCGAIRRAGAGRPADEDRGDKRLRPGMLSLQFDPKLSNSRSIFHHLSVSRSLPHPHSPSPFPSVSSRQIRPAAPFSSRWIQAGSGSARRRRLPFLPQVALHFPSLSRLLPLPESAAPPPRVVDGPPPWAAAGSPAAARRQIRPPGSLRAPPPAPPRDPSRWATRARPPPPPLGSASWVVQRG